MLLPVTNDIEEARIITWFSKGLRNEFIRLSKKQRQLQFSELLLLNNQISSDPCDEETEYIDTIADGCNTFTQVTEKLTLQDALSQLTQKQRSVVFETILEEKTLEKVANQLGISKQAVSKIRKRALRKLREHFHAQN